MVGKWQKVSKSQIAKNKKNKQIPEKWQGQKWIPNPPKGALIDPMNRFIRLILFLDPVRGRSPRGGRSRAFGRAASNGVDNNEMLALSDLRRFAKVLCGPKEIITNLPDLKNLGPDPLEQEFTYKKFKELFYPPPDARRSGKKGKIKQVLMDQSFISGIGNIYADEILWLAKIHPQSRVEKLSEAKLKIVYRVMRKILQKALALRGASVDDYRDAAGRRGKYDLVRYAYQRENEPCPRCRTKIKRLKIGGRSAHFCPKCQKL